ncbi:MAG: agmatine deiminase family protein [Pseudomonadota bacterium]
MPEWNELKFVWVGWPSAEHLWGEDFELAREEIRRLTLALAKNVEVRLIAEDAAEAETIKSTLNRNINIFILPSGDIWLRDTGPLYVEHSGTLAGLRFRFNGWGGKYNLPGDQETAAAMLAVDGLDAICSDITLEGGAIEHNGAGTLLTTRQCLLNPNRNPGWTEAIAEEALRKALNVSEFIWLDDGLVGDHTDGHVDNLARFVSETTVVCEQASGPDDPNTEIYAAVEATLRASGLEVITLASPGRVTDRDGTIMPASHLNFVFANGALIMPTFEDHFAPQALQVLKSALPDYDIIGLPARHILSGGGAFHCITQHVPLLGKGR